jgi:transglutaminase-like putative cysteine protease
MDLRRSLTATLSLAALSAAVAAGLGRLLRGDEWVAVVIGAALLPHLLGALTRGRTDVLQAGVWLTGLVAYCVGVVVPTTAGFRGWSTVEGIGRSLGRGLAVLRDQAPPVSARPGVVLLAVVVVWTMAASADALAFRRWASIGALAPGATLFIWISALAPGTAHAAWAAGAVVLTGGGFLAVQHQVLLVRHRPGGSDRAVPAPRHAVAGLVLASAAALVAAVLAPTLPGAGADPLLDLRDDRTAGSSTYQTSVPPLVDVADNLTRGERVELFTVDSPSPQYWRTVALDEYSTDAGGQWTLRAAGGDIEHGLRPAASPAGLRQEFRIRGLTERWMPAAFRPVWVEEPDVLVVADSRTLVSGRTSLAGLSYSVVSTPPPDDAETRRRATGAAVPERLRTFTTLPTTVPAAVIDLARSITSGATTPLERAQRLRDHFRDGSYTYDADVDLDDAADATTTFLRIRRGFCVQFASTFALMARAVGIPSRVAVGFTPGTFDPSTARFRVTNFEAHAWPEVWLAGVGWTNRFEPTPPSADPGGSDLPGDGAPGAATPVSPTPSSTVAPSPSAPVPPAPVPSVGAGTGSRRAGDGGIATVVLGVVAVSAVLGAALAVRPVTRARRRAARRRRPDPSERVAGAWEEAIDQLRDLGEPRPTHRTPSEVAARAVVLVGTSAAAPLADLATAHVAAQFGSATTTDDAADSAWRALDTFRHAVRERLARPDRIRARLGWRTRRTRA